MHSIRKPLIAANWKMNKTSSQAVDFIKRFNELTDDVSDKEILICPPFTLLYTLKEILPRNAVLGAQDVYFEQKGAFTGEISPEMLLDAGCEYVIIGHSERRHIIKENDELINKKVLSAINCGLIAILCVGETLEQRGKGLQKKIISQQLEKGLLDVNKPLRIVIAYEPVWAIGTGKVATDEQAQEMHKFIRDELCKIFAQDAARQIRIIYGGSVKPENIKGIMEQEDIDGVLVGGASLDPNLFAKIVKY